MYILGRRKNSLEKVASKAVSSPISTMSYRTLTFFKINQSIIPIIYDIASKESLAAAAAEVAKQSPFVNAVIANYGIGGQMH